MLFQTENSEIAQNSKRKSIRDIDCPGPRDIELSGPYFFNENDGNLGKYDECYSRGCDIWYVTYQKINTGKLKILPLPEGGPPFE